MTSTKLQFLNVLFFCFIFFAQARSSAVWEETYQPQSAPAKLLVQGNKASFLEEAKDSFVKDLTACKQAEACSWKSRSRTNKTTQKEMPNDAVFRKPRLLCLHGFRTSGLIMKTQIGRWPEQVLDKLDLVYPDAPFPATGNSGVEGIFDPPYYEWFQFSEEYTEYTNLDECIAFIEEYMIEHGPFDGFVGFSQGALLSAGLPGLQAKGLALTKVPKIKFLIIMGGGKFLSPTMAEKAFSSPIQCPSLHFIGEADFLKEYGLELLESCVDPIVIHHHKGHTVPRLDEKSLQIMLGFIEKIRKILAEEEEEPVKTQKMMLEEEHESVQGA